LVSNELFSKGEAYPKDWWKGVVCLVMTLDLDGPPPLSKIWCKIAFCWNP